MCAPANCTPDELFCQMGPGTWMCALVDSLLEEANCQIRPRPGPWMGALADSHLKEVCC